ncbi:MAG TPA: glycosyltransferase family 39 protein, partial [Pyrinomonadaceae bacterium]|nr:glycosyltransferase family 39 protein [Pyrinomonadaceae bacterium]
AFTFRFLSWQDNRFEVRKVQTVVTEDYKRIGRLLQQGGVRSFFSSSSPLSDPNNLGHPPGYSILIAAVFSLFGESDAALQIIQILADSLAAIVIFLLALEQLNTSIAVIAGLLVAVAPQFTYNSVLLLPDSLTVLPILLAVYLLNRATKQPRIVTLAMAGAALGLSCWLRANSMLLAPFICLSMPFLFERGRRFRYAIAIVFGALIVIAPLTIRNYIVYDHFIPISLGGGQTLLEGIGDYDESGSLGIPNTDMGVMKWEAEVFNRPDYFGTLFNPDGVERDRWRISHGLKVIASHPLWFAGVMLRRGAGILRLERARLISANPPLSHSPEVASDSQPTWSSSAKDLFAGGRVASAQAKVSLDSDNQMLRIESDQTKYDAQFIYAPIKVERQTDYILRLPVQIEQGRISIGIVNAKDNSQLASVIVEPLDWKSATEQPLNVIEIPFVSSNTDAVRVVFSNEASKEARNIVQVGAMQLFALGPAFSTWTRFPRAVVRLIQKPFITAVMLPLAILGLILLIRVRERRTVVILLIVPAYYLLFQSMLHTEYRYVLAIHYFLFVLVSVAVYWLGSCLRRGLLEIRFFQNLLNDL